MSLPPSPKSGQGGVWVWYPDTLDVDALVESLGQRVAEGVLLLGHFISTALANDARCRDSGRVPLKAAYLRKVIGPHHLNAVRRASFAVGYVDRRNSYQAGQRSQCYWLMPPHDSAPLVRRPIEDRGLRRNLKRWIATRQRESWRRIDQGQTRIPAEVCHYLWRCLRHVRVHAELALGNGLHPKHQVAVEQFRRGDLWLTVDDYGRLHTNLSSFPKVLRHFLTVDGLKLTCIDISESQPLFIALVLAQQASLQKQGQTTHPAALPYDAHTMMLNCHLCDVAIDRERLADDLRHYLELCEGRRLYSTLAEGMNTTRDVAKKKLMAVVFGRPWHSNTLSEMMDKMFPNVMETMRRIKRPDYRRLAHFAQGVESAFMFRRVVPRIMAERPDLWISTIHDCVVTTEGNGEWVRGVMLDEFGRLGLSPQVKVEACSQGTDAKRGMPSQRGY